MSLISTHPYDNLTPEVVLDVVEAAGFRTNGRLFGLNSYENRVYQVGIEDDTPLIIKFYRPGRWNAAQLREEHEFCRDLLEHEIPVVAPLPLAGGQSLGESHGFYFALFPQRGGQAPDISLPDTLFRLGQWLGRIHAVGEIRPFTNRPTIDIVGQLERESRYLLEHDWVPADLRTGYETLVRDLIDWSRQKVTEAGPYRALRLHGDCHLGNILMRDEQILFVDFDDARTGPAIQDLWLLLSGSEAEQAVQFAELLEGYENFHEFDYRQRLLIEPLRTLRQVAQSAWLARRWDDPAFPRHFPWFTQPRYWSDQILGLREQLAALQGPPLTLPGQSG